MKKVAITDHVFPSIDGQRSVFDDAGIMLSEIQPSCRTEDDVIRSCGEFDALLVQWAPITRRVLEALPGVRCVARYGIGVDNIDLAAARELGRTVMNVPGFCLEEVSNHAVAMMLSLARRIPQDHQQMVQGGWGIKPFLPIRAMESLTLGLVGFGAIAQKVCDKARVFGIRVIATDPVQPSGVFQQHGAEPVALDTLLTSSDIISLHCPLLPATQHLIREETIAKMKSGVILINTSRGPVIKEEDLVTALQNGRLSGAGLDVFEAEPLPLSSPLRTLTNVILTSHAASVSDLARERLQISAAKGVRDFLLGITPMNALS